MGAILLTNRESGRQLQTGRLLSLTDAAGARVRCVAGKGWITVEGDRADYWLAAGGSFEVRSRARVIIEAMRDSRLDVVLPHARQARADELSGAVAG